MKQVAWDGTYEAGIRIMQWASSFGFIRDPDRPMNSPQGPVSLYFKNHTDDPDYLNVLTPGGPVRVNKGDRIVRLDDGTFKVVAKKNA